METLGEPTSRREYVEMVNEVRETKESKEEKEMEKQQQEKTEELNKFESVTHVSPNTPACRICLEHIQTVSKLICPCNCRGSVAKIHSHCLEKWVDTTHNTVCQICKCAYEIESCGWRALSEWNWPRPLSEQWDDVVDFRCALLWLLYMIRFAYLATRFGINELSMMLKQTVGDGKIAQIWWLGFTLNCVYYSCLLSVIFDQWLLDNTTYRFKDHTVLVETAHNTVSRASTRSAHSEHVSRRSHRSAHLQFLPEKRKTA